MSFPRHVEFLIATTYLYNAASLQEPSLNAYLHNVKKRDKTQKSRHKHLRNTKPALATLFCLHIHHFKLHIIYIIMRRGCALAYKTMSTNLGNLSAIFQINSPIAPSKYSTYDRELQAIYMAVKHFRKMFEGRRLIIFTVHKPLSKVN